MDATAVPSPHAGSPACSTLPVFPGPSVRYSAAGAAPLSSAGSLSSASSPCTVACPLNVNLVGVTRVADARCIGCQVCVIACPCPRGSLSLRLGWPVRLRLTWPARRPTPATTYS